VFFYHECGERVGSVGQATRAAGDTASRSIRVVVWKLLVRATLGKGAAWATGAWRIRWSIPQLIGLERRN
jgi:hypothetical protein